LEKSQILVARNTKGCSALQPLPEVRFRKMPTGLADGLGLGSVLRRLADSPRKAMPSVGSPASRVWRRN